MKSLLVIAKLLFGTRQCAALICASMLLSIHAGCRPTATSSDTTGDTPAAVETEEEETPITADDVPLPADYADAVKRLYEYRETVRQAVASGHLHDAHRPLDETNIALERLPAIAKASGVPRRKWETIVLAGDDLAEAMDAIHADIDAGQAPDYEAHAPTIDDALHRLETITDKPVLKTDSTETNS